MNDEPPGSQGRDQFYPVKPMDGFGWRQPFSRRKYPAQHSRSAGRAGFLKIDCLLNDPTPGFTSLHWARRSASPKLRSLSETIGVLHREYGSSPRIATGILAPQRASPPIVRLITVASVSMGQVWPSNNARPT